MEGVILDQHQHQQRQKQEGDDDRIVMDLPPGFRFHPTDEEIITHYLTEKVINTSFSACTIAEVDLNKSEPWDLPSKAKMGEKEYYFFCQRDRKYPTGMRTNRATEAGYWKATGKDKEIYAKLGSNNSNKSLIGMKKTLVFYKGRAPKGEKSNWVMHEYRLEGHFSYYNLPKPAKDEWVVCRVFHKSTGGGGIKKIPGVMLMQQLPPFDSSRDDFLANYYYAAPDSSSLPPLMDPHPHPHPPPAASSSFANDDDHYQDQDFKAANNNITSSSSISYYQPHDKINSNHNYPSGAAAAAAAYLHHQGILIRSNTNTNTGTRQDQDQDQDYCKVEQFSSNNQSVISCRSQDTSLSTDNYINNTNTEISSSLAFSNNNNSNFEDHATATTSIAEFDSFCWDY